MEGEESDLRSQKGWVPIALVIVACSVKKGGPLWGGTLLINGVTSGFRARHHDGSRREWAQYPLA